MFEQQFFCASLVDSSGGICCHQRREICFLPRPRHRVFIRGLHDDLEQARPLCAGQSERPMDDTGTQSHAPRSRRSPLHYVSSSEGTSSISCCANAPAAATAGRAARFVKRSAPPAKSGALAFETSQSIGCRRRDGCLGREPAPSDRATGRRTDPLRALPRVAFW